MHGTPRCKALTLRYWERGEKAGGGGVYRNQNGVTSWLREDVTLRGGHEAKDQKATPEAGKRQDEKKSAIEVPSMKRQSRTPSRGYTHVRSE